MFEVLEARTMSEAKRHSQVAILTVNETMAYTCTVLAEKAEAVFEKGAHLVEKAAADQVVPFRFNVQYQLV
ncbi:hypothetical protein HanXRQr2_Chr08g0338851 [Helianthus annuus]|uniref:Uncharacterized protein n=1 Tax=Helianthus annuus TaxID=4232 RepID=A0A9K3NCG9_HELAN|nr:hypothetical protein HanXRQr2_Chr08g0338851 [Helianthus annuus]